MMAGADEHVCGRAKSNLFRIKQRNSFTNYTGFLKRGDTPPDRGLGQVKASSNLGVVEVTIFLDNLQVCEYQFDLEPWVE